MENISEMIWEVIYVILLVMGITFIFLIFRNLNKSTDSVNDEVRTKIDIQEDNMGYTGYNVVDGSSVYYDIVNSVRDINETGTANVYKIMVDGTEVKQEWIHSAQNGNSKLLLALLGDKINGYFRKSYQQDASGNISQVNYNYVGMDRKTATGLN